MASLVLTDSSQLTSDSQNLGIIIVVVCLVLWLPLPLNRVAFWKSPLTTVPCTDLLVQDVWIQTFPKLTSESAVRVSDLNQDGVLDVILGYGTGADGRDVPKFVCDLYFGKQAPCLGGVIALDGRTGGVMWKHWTTHPVYSLDCSTDLTGDGVMDCLVTGKGGVFCTLNGHDGSKLWQFSEDNTQPFNKASSVEPLMNMYSARFIHDINGDGALDILAVQTLDSVGKETGVTLSGRILLVSGAEGRLLQTVATPMDQESYYCPQLLVRPDGEELVVFGTGGYNSPGGLYVVPLLTLGNAAEVKVLYQDQFKGVLSPAVLADINQDGSEDIIVATFNASVLAFDGLTFKLLWNYTFQQPSETFSPPTPAFFNEDNIPDFLVKYQTGAGYPVYYYSQVTVLDGLTGSPLLDKPIIDTVGSQMSALTVSMESQGNDWILFWTADCLGHQGATQEYSFMPGSSVHSQSRADVCKLLFNSTAVTKLLALSRHVQSPGIVVYSSDSRRPIEFNSSTNTTAEVHNYLISHPDFLDISNSNQYFNNYPQDQFSTEKKGLLKSKGSIFRHKEKRPPMKSGSSHYENYSNMNHRHSKVYPPEVGEQPINGYSSPGEFPNIHKHGVEHLWNHQKPWKNNGHNPEDEDNGPQDKQWNYDLYGPLREDSYKPLQRDERSGHVRKQRYKRGINTGSGIQRITSTGAVLAPLEWAEKNNHFDLVFVTYWIPPSAHTRVLLPSDRECVMSKQGEFHGCGKQKRGVNKHYCTRGNEISTRGLRENEIAQRGGRGSEAVEGGAGRHIKRDGGTSEEKGGSKKGGWTRNRSTPVRRPDWKDRLWKEQFYITGRRDRDTPALSSRTGWDNIDIFIKQ
uniref:FAM234A/B beta-propeller domain-containing protein n=1 Tax=Timema shepardi TaxID=629360 RepID=A0A7R9AYM6_TIMSH|nr:unnamed protein product [Timema shepardi]